MKLWQSKHDPHCKLSQQSLLDISEKITQEYAPYDSHHQPELVLMPVDPVNLYAYWNLKQHETDQTIEHVDKPLALRIYSLTESDTDPENIKLSFDITVEGLQKQQKIHLPLAASAYSAVIGEINADHSFSPLASSDTIHVPREHPATENIANDLGNIPQTDTQQQAIFATDQSQVPCQLPLDYLENNVPTLVTEQLPDKLTIVMPPPAEPYSETLILQNFKGYGYDLKVHQPLFDIEADAILQRSTEPMQAGKPQTRSTNISNNQKNTSGHGRLS